MTRPEPSLLERGETRPKGALANAAWNTGGTICGIAISLFTAPLLIHNLGTAQYGIFLLIGSITGLLSVMNFGLGEATLRYVARYHGARDMVGVNRVFASTLWFYILVSIAVSVILLTAAPIAVTYLNVQPSQHEMVGQLVRLTGLVFAVRIITSAFAVVPSALQRYDISSKIGVGVNVLRTGGYVALVIAGFQLIHLIVWDLVVGIAVGVFWVLVARRLLPGLKLLPRFSFLGLRETMSYGIFSFLTWAFHTMHRESGKLMLGQFLGATPVAYLGAPDNIAQRLHMVVATGSEALVPRFSADQDSKSSEALYWNALWFALTLSLILLVPFFVLVPDFLRLWIGPEFARQSATAGQLLALYLIWQGAFAPVASYYRGAGKPWYVTVAILLALIITVLTGLRLIPSYGVVGAAYSYLAGSAAPLLAVVVGGFYAFGRSAVRGLLHSVALPLAAGFATCVSGLMIRGWIGELTWISMCALGTLMVSLGSALIVGGDWLTGGDESPSRQLMGRLGASRKLLAILRLIPVRSAG